MGRREGGPSVSGVTTLKSSAAEALVVRCAHAAMGQRSAAMASA